MRIRELKLIRYGKFTGRTLSLPARDCDFHLIVGPNEAGKSTVRSAICDWLFGIPARTSLAFLHPMPELRVGGEIERLASGGSAAQRLEFERTKGNKNTLRTPQDVPLTDIALQPFLGSLQAAAFSRMYALDHATLVEGGDGILSASDDVGRMLFQSAAGVEHLGDALKKLEVDADALWGPRKASSRLYYQAAENYESANTQFKQATLRTKDWVAQHDSLVTTHSALEDARKRGIDVRRQLNRLERIRRVRPTLVKLEAARKRREELLENGEIPLLAADAAEVLREARQSMVVVEADLQRLQQDTFRTKTELESTQVDKNILSLAADITELNERRLQFRAHRTDILKRTDEIRNLWVRAQELAEGLNWRAQDEESVRQRLPAAVVRLRVERLLRQRPTIEQELGAARTNLTEQKRKIELTRQALAGLSTDAIHPGLDTAVDQALRLGDYPRAMDELQERIDSVAHAIETGLAALGIWRAEPEALKAMVVPDLAHVRGLIEQYRSDAAEAQAQQSALDDSTQDLERLELELRQFVRAFQPVSMEQVHEARHLRDLEWQAIKSTPHELLDRAGRFEIRVGEADNLADARLDRAQHEAARQAKAERIEQQRLDLQNQQSRIQTVQGRREARLAEWSALTDSCGLPRLPLELAPIWLEQRQSILNLVSERAELGRQQLAKLEAGAKAQVAIWQIVGPESSRGSAPQLAECVRQAQAQMKLADQAVGQRDALEQQLQEAQGSLLALQETVQGAENAWTAWEGAWTVAVQAAGYEGAVLPDQVEVEVEVMQEIERLLGQIRAIRSERIDTMQLDLDDLASSANGLAERVAPDLASHSPEAIALELAERLDQARRAEAASADLQSRLNGFNNDLAAVNLRQIAVQSNLAPLLMAAAVEDMDALSVAIERSDDRRQVENEIQQTESELIQAGDGLPLDDLRAEVSSIGPDELSAELGRSNALSEELVREISELSTRHGSQQSAFDAFNGDDAAARADARRQEAIAAMADAAERYLQLHTASRVLRWSIEKFRETKQGPMLAKASAIFKTLTLDSFSRLLVDAEGQSPRLLGIRPSGEQVDVAGMSVGSRDQLYLALRLAAMELQVEQGLNMPLIADDLFINFDDDRTAAGLKVLGDLSQHMQVVFLTHHDHLVPLARKVLGADLNVVLL